MSKAVEFLNENPIQYLATVGRDGKAKCRPFMFAGEVDGKHIRCLQRYAGESGNRNLCFQPVLRMDPSARNRSV